MHIHAGGKSSYAQAKELFCAAGLADKERVRLEEYIYDMPLLMAAADLVICRAGAMTLTEIARMKKPAIVIPSPNVVENHQYKNAKVLADAGAAILLIIIFIIGSIVRNVERSNAERDASIAASESEAAERLALATEAGNLLLEAQTRAEMLDYDGAIAILDSFSGNSAEFPAIVDARNMYTELKSSMICWSNPDQVLTLSFQQLIADPDRAFNDDVYANSYKNNFVTVDEFSAILQQLYLMLYQQQRQEV